MAYRYLIDQEEAKKQAAVLAASLKENTGKSDFVGYAVGVISRRLRAQPQKYREFGMYWPAIKQLLNEHGAGLGDDLIGDVVVAPYGQYETPAALIAAAEGFKDFYRETWFQGTNQFTIDDDGTSWAMFDEDMESMLAS